MTTMKKILSAVLILASGLSAGASETAETKSYTGKRMIYLSPLSEEDRVFKAAHQPDTTPTTLADELRGYLERIDGKEWSVSEEGYENDGILLALTKLPLVSLEDKTQLGKMNKEGYMVQADEKSIVLVGNTVLGLQNAVFDLLERLGCRFLLPPEAWTIIPEKTGLKLAMGKIFNQPDYVYRRSYTGSGGALQGPAAGTAPKDRARWNRTTRQVPHANVHNGHAWQDIVMRNDEELRTNPEYFRIGEDGKRWGHAHPKVQNAAGKPIPTKLNFCPSNPGLKALCAVDRIRVLEKARKRFPTEYTVSMEPNDGSRACLCDKCKALGNPTDRMLHLANHVAREIRKKYPEAKVGVSLYPPHNQPPEKEKIEPNMQVMVCLAFNNTGKSFNELMTAWVEAGAEEVMVYDYYGISQWGHGMPGTGPGFKNIAYKIPWFYKNWNVRLALMETSHAWGHLGPSMYLMRKLFWDIDADAEAIYSDWFHHAFGAGAKDMRKLFDLWEAKSDTSAMTDANVLSWLRLLEAAAKAARNESPAVKRRIADMMSYVHFVKLYHEARQVRYSTKKEELQDNPQIMAKWKELYSFMWRTRHRQMTHPYAFWYWSADALNPVLRQYWKFQVPAGNSEYKKYWDWGIGGHRGDAIFTKEADYSTTEMLAIFKRDLAEYKEKTASFVTYSKDLVPLFQGAAETYHPYKDSKGTRHGMIGKTYWRFYVDEPTRLRIALHTQWTEKSRWKYGEFLLAELRDNKGSVVYSKEAAAFEKPQWVSEIKANLERGSYYLYVHSSGRPCYPLFEPAVKYTYEQSVERSSEAAYFGPGFFYVPKGTKDLLINNQGIVSIRRASQKPHERKEYNKPGVISIPVADEDGKVWEFRGLVNGKYQLLNVPPYIATVKENLLVPREVLEKDGAPEESNE